MSETEEQPLTTKKQFLSGVCEGFYGKPWTLEQRKHLFNRMERFDMSTYLYAPKDDYKHRLCWRELYCKEEADELRILIESSKRHNISFVYALSPGLDIVYSNAEDVAALKMKLDQVKNIGCSHFALLFDDIEDELSAEDATSYPSIAHAQCSVTNEMYRYLGEPELFLFCPTEYCSSRAVPDMAKSLYLQTIGNQLDANIDFLWTGPRVVSRHITVESIKEVTAIVKRPVTIWDNLHANDYDQTRLYLGPYDGRPTRLVAHLRGVLTNPNCEFEANFIAMHTLAQWSKDSCRRFPALTSRDDVDMETEEEEEVAENEEVADEDGDGEKRAWRYCPKKALVMAVTDWLPELYKTRKSSASPKMQQSGEPDGNRGDDDDAKMKKSEKKSCSAESKKRFDRLTVMDVILLCDLFCLPYEHGPQAIQLLQSARWLLSNSALLVERPGGKGLASRGRIEWYDKAIHFHDCYANLSIVVDRFVNIPNRELLYELYSYVNDMRSNLALVNSYIKWHGIDKPDKEPFKSGEQEPWVHRGGLMAEFRRLLPIDRSNDLGGLGVKLPDLPSHSYIIRQYFSADKDEVYDICMKTFDDQMDASDTLSASFPQLPGDYLVGFLLDQHPQHCFVVEDESGICGYAAVAPSARDYYKSMAEDWMPQLRKKYPQLEVKDSEATTDAGATRQLTLEAVLKQVNGVLPTVGDDLIEKYPVFIRTTVLPGRVGGRSVCKSLMRAVTKTLTGGGGRSSASDDGARGLHTVIPIDNHAQLQFYYSIGFTDVTDSCTGLDSVSWIVLASTVEA